MNIRFPKIIRDFRAKESIKLNDYLALERTRLANERTLLSYIRTSLYLILGGIAFLRLSDLENLRQLGYGILTLALFFIVFGLYRFTLLRRRLQKFYEDDPKTDENA